ncbi:hypothetical protein [Polyangium spumosum]|uniref:Uncharacterized protein n=1 Tax=Polyangium spumosum TaxID=889282 RepID=A0A6N7Q181_9BACT|nr:hypothetical protein [Polyangium spumosum]MRG98242.1 hypothetical protein [Polyangium spumosum]
MATENEQHDRARDVAGIISVERPFARTLGCGEAQPAPSSTSPRSTTRPSPSLAEPTQPQRRHRTPIEEVNDVFRQLRIPELADVLLFAQRTLAAREAGPDPSVISELLAAMSRLHPAYKNTQGVPLPILRGALVAVPRAALEAALLRAEREGSIKLVAASPLTPFIERQAGIQDSKRGLLYFCAAPAPAR